MRRSPIAPRLATAFLVALAAIPLAAAARAAAPAPQQKPLAVGHMLELTAILRQDPPADLIEKKAAAEDELKVATDGEKRRLRRLIQRLDKDIARGRGYVLHGWSAEVDRRRGRVGSSTGMSAFFVPGGPTIERALRTPEGWPHREPHFVLVSNQGATDLFNCGGRRYREAKRIEPTRKPSWWMSMHREKPTPALQPEAFGTVDVSISFERDEAKDSGLHLYRYIIALKAPRAPEGAAHLTMIAHVHARTPQGRSFGPLPVMLELPRGARTGTFNMTRSFEIIARPGVAIEKDAATIDVIGAAYR